LLLSVAKGSITGAFQELECHSVTAIIAATSWVLTSYLKNFVHELKPNGGGSMKDTVNQIHSEITELRISVAKLEGQFTQHLAEMGKNE